MNRRTVLRSAAVAATAGLAGCVEAVEDHFEGELVSPVPVEITSDAERAYNVQLEAYERGTDRQTYDVGISVTPDSVHSPEHLEGTDQRFRVVRFGEDGGEEDALVEQGVITTNTRFVSIRIDDDTLELEIRTGEEADDAENASAEADGEETG